MSQSEPRVVSVFRFIAVYVVQNVLGILRSKSIAILWGVAGVGILGQILTFYSFQTKILMFGVTASLVNSVNAAHKNNWSQNDVRFYNLLIVATMNAVVAILLISSPEGWAQLIFADQNHQDLLLLMTALGLVYSIATFLELNFQADLQYRTLALGRGLSFGTGIVFIVPLVYFFGVAGVILDLMIVFVISTLFFSVKMGAKRLTSFIFPSAFIGKILQYVLRVSSYDVLRTIAVIGALLIARIHILHVLGAVGNGYFQSVWAVANYVDVILQGFMVYFYPTITKTDNILELRQELGANFQLLIYLLLPVLVLLVIVPELFLMLLFSHEFTSMKDLLAIAALAKGLNLFYFFYSIVFLGKNHLRLFLSLEILRGVSLATFTMLLVEPFEITGAVWAFVLSDVVCFLFVVFSLWKISALRLARKDVQLYLRMLLLLLVTYFVPSALFVKFAVAIILFFILFDYREYRKLLQELFAGKLG